MERIESFEYWDSRLLLSKFFVKLNNLFDRLPYPLSRYGFCLHCFRLTSQIHDSTDQSFHCWNCCWEKEYLEEDEEEYGWHDISR